LYLPILVTFPCYKKEAQPTYTSQKDNVSKVPILRTIADCTAGVGVGGNAVTRPAGNERTFWGPQGRPVIFFTSKYSRQNVVLIEWISPSATMERVQ